MIFDDQIFYLNGGEYSSNEAHILFMIGMRRFFPNLVFCSRLSPTPDSGCYLIPGEIEICTLPYYKNIFDLYAKSIILLPQIWRKVKSNIHAWDIICLSWPNPVSMLIIIMVKIKFPKKLIMLLVRQNLKKLVKLRYHGIKKIIAVFMVELLESLLKLFGKTSIIFPLSKEVYQKFIGSFKNVHLIRLPPLSNNNINKLKLRDVLKPNDTLQLLYVGRLESEKGLPYLFQSLIILKKQYIKFHLNLVGTGQDEKELQKLAAEYHLNKEISFHGYIKYGESLFSFYKNSDLFILPSLSEGSPNVLMEAMAFGVPIIATNVGGIPEIIHHNQNGLLVEAGSAKALAEAISDLTSNSLLINSFRKQYKIDSQSYTMEAYQEKMYSIISKQF